MSTYTCPKCGSNEVLVNDSRPKGKLGHFYRRRQCQACWHRFTTIEMPLTEYNDILQADEHLQALKRIINEI